MERGSPVEFAREVAPEEIECVADSGEEAGVAELIDSRLRPYFQPDARGVPDDDSGAVVNACLDDAAFVGGACETADE